MPGEATPAGAFDTSFSNDGIVPLFRADDLALDDEGRILVGGRRANTLGYVARFEPDGSPDNTYGSEGDAPIDTSYYPVSIATEGSEVFAAGSVTGADGGVIKLDENGTVDDDWGDDGVAVYDGPGFDGPADAVAVSSDGYVAIGGADGFPDGSWGYVARFNPAGELDDGFAGDGSVDVNAQGAYNGVQAITIQPDGRIITAGTVVTLCPGRAGPGCFYLGNAIVTRLNTDGIFDSSWADNGRMIFDLDGVDRLRDMAISPSPAGTLLLGGTSEIECCFEDSHTLVSRIELDNLDDDRDGDGVLDGADPCPTRFQPGDGCPSYGRELEIYEVKRDDGALEIAGGVDRSAEGCIVANDPVLEIKRKGTWRRLKGAEDFLVPHNVFSYQLEPEPSDPLRMTLKAAKAPGVGDCEAADPVKTAAEPYSHSIVAGGFDEMSSATRFTPGTSLMIRFEIRSRRS